MKQFASWKKLAIGLSVAAAMLACQSHVMAADAVPTANMVTTDTGLKYLDTTVGQGSTALTGDTVSVHYTGWLQNPDGSKGRKFDSSRDRNTPFDFTLGQRQVIPGWEEGVRGMKVGGARQLVIPAALGYGSRGAGGGLIPANATLIFDVELLKIK